MCADVFFASAPPPVSLGSIDVRRCTGDPPRLRSQGVLSIVASCWHQGQPAAATADFSSNAAGASSMLRLSEDQIQRKPGRNNLVQESETQCAIHPCSEAERRTGQGEGKALPCCSSFLSILLARSRASPKPSAHIYVAPHLWGRRPTHPCKVHAAACARCGKESNFTSRMCQCMRWMPAGHRETHAPRDISTYCVLMHTPSANL